ncbi:MAG TPA: serine/threonine-protein kinase [bacterium]|nr:serine/threonine-protein kinase [bacterium]
MITKIRRGYEIEGYLLEEMVGAGGFSSVYKARSIFPIPKYDTIIAVKVLHPRRLDRKQIGRFAREARISMQLMHPNIIRVYDIVKQDRNMFILMEYLDADLMTAIKTKRRLFDPVNIVEIIKKAGRGLAYVHENGIIHKDVNPSNILISYSLERIKFTDFGLASQRSFFRREEDVKAGTEGYLAPERLKGSLSDIRTDIYAFGKTIENIYRELGFEFSENILRIVRKATHPDKEERFSNMKSLLDSLNEKV